MLCYIEVLYEMYICALLHVQFHQTFMIAATMLAAFGIVAIVSANYNNYTVAPGLISFSCVSSASICAQQNISLEPLPHYRLYSHLVATMSCC